MSVRSAFAVAAVLGGLAVSGAWTASKPASANPAQGMKWTATLNSMGGGTIERDRIARARHGRRIFSRHDFDHWR